jgi:tetratricopeptide (TPR) repeat protein
MMQLDLFTDNRANILLNIADEYLLAQNFAKALSTCGQVRDEYPENRQAAQLYFAIEIWQAQLAGIESTTCEPGRLNEMHSSLGSVTHPALRTAVMETLVTLLQTLPEADAIFIPPRFHLGHLLLERRRFAEATRSFRRALSSPNLERGRFLAWSADAMTRAGNAEDAVNLYLQAFLEDPATVDVQGITHPAIQRLHQHCAANADGIDDDGEVAWLPVWGWLQGLFPLPVQHPPVFDELEARIDSEESPLPQLWYELLTRAEYLRTMVRDDREMTAVRRLMKRLNEEMFDCYMQKIRGKRP